MMKLLYLVVFFLTTLVANAQTTEEWLQQKKTQIKYLGQQIAKLQIYLSYMKKGYIVVNKGLSTIGEIKSGDLHLHEYFFDKLKTVSPSVKGYSKIADIISIQAKIIAAYKSYWKEFRQSGVYTQSELDFIHKLLAHALDNTANLLDDLRQVIANGRVQMNDEERFRRIDTIYVSVNNDYRFVISFCQKTKLTYLQRLQELKELRNLQKLF